MPELTNQVEADKRARSPTPIMLNLYTYAPSPSGTHLSSVQDLDPVITTPYQPNAQNGSATVNLNHIFTAKKPTIRRNLSSDIIRAADVSIKDKAKKASSSFSNAMYALYNDNSLFMYRTNERIHHKLPQMVREKRELRNINESVNIANSDLRDGSEVLQIMQTIENFDVISQLAQSSLLLMKTIKEAK
ncbi:hypothetical protein K7432_013290 [Basidiobolus ranarum]|uniref:BLOC-1-related complex subunit 5 n=1 Tax=Basidiobolus ranarum TaxID=34480 RepID=A0ABR2WJE9_9FUNG